MGYLFNSLYFDETRLERSPLRKLDTPRFSVHLTVRKGPEQVAGNLNTPFPFLSAG